MILNLENEKNNNGLNTIIFFFLSFCVKEKHVKITVNQKKMFILYLNGDAYVIFLNPCFCTSQKY